MLYNFHKVEKVSTIFNNNKQAARDVDKKTDLLVLVDDLYLIIYLI